MAEPRELILKLGQKITDRIGVKVTENDPEYWGLASVVTDGRSCIGNESQSTGYRSRSSKEM